MSTAGEIRLDAAVLAALYAEHAEELRRFLLGLLRDGDLAGEVLQSTWVKALEQGHAAREESLKGWLFRVAYHEALQIRRRRQVHEKSVQGLAWIKAEAGLAADAPALRQEAVARVRKAVSHLPADQQTVVRMRIYEDKTFAVIAAELNLPLGTVLSRMRLAVGKLTRALASDQEHS